jgi:hypothetical protein
MTATEQMSADVTLVINHILRDEDRQYAIHTKSNKNAQLAVRVAEQTFANPAELGAVVEWVITAMAWNARSRSLTYEEIRIQAAALRVIEAVKMFELIAQLGPAFEAKDWDEARRVWEQLRPFHAQLIASYPDVAGLDVLLHDPDGQPPNAIH